MIQQYKQLNIPTLIITTLCPHNRLVIGEVVFCEFCSYEILNKILKNRMRDSLIFWFPGDEDRWQHFLDLELLGLTNFDLD